jgi:hypothetical protein
MYERKCLALSKSFILKGTIVHIISRNYTSSLEDLFSEMNNLKAFFIKQTLRVLLILLI